jgi:hypothetical protein
MSAGGNRICLGLPNLRKEAFLALLSSWRRENREGVVVWDGAGSHRAKGIEEMGIKSGRANV